MSKIRLFGTSSGYVEIAPAAAASNNTLTAPSTVGEIIAKDAAGAIGVTSIVTTNATITTAKVGAAVTISESGIEASGIGITCANINGAQIGGRRNLVINGAMTVAQRGTSSTSAGYATVDRFRIYTNGVDEAPTQSQVDVSSGTGPYTEGFRKSFKITNGNQTSGAGSGDYIFIRHMIEAQNVSNSGWNYTSSSSDVTLSFWVKASVAQNYYFSVLSSDGALQNFPMETGSLTADTWTKITKTIPGASNVQFDNNTGIGIEIDWWPFAGTNYTASGVALNTWAAYSSGTRFPDHTSTWYTTNDATFEITGVQLEVGAQATPFEHHSFGEELALCQRYYCHTYSYGVYPGSNYNTQSLARQGMLFNYRQRDTNYQAFQWSPPTEMRAVPTQTHYSMLGTAGKASGSTTDYTVATNSPHNGPSGVMCYGDNTIANDGYVHFVLDAEL